MSRKQNPSVLVLEPLEDTLWNPSEWNDGISLDPVDGSRFEYQTCKVPEGLMCLAVCRACGGHHEHVVDLREDPNLVMAEGPRLLKNRLDQWQERHAACDSKPRVHAIPDWVVRLTEHRVEEARERLAKGQVVEPALTVGGLDAPVVGVEVPSVVAGRHANQVGRAAWHAALRQALRELMGRPEAALLVSEIWTAGPGPVRPSLAEDREEGLMVLQFTRHVCRAGLSAIHRPSGRVDTGPGHLGELQWFPGVARSNICAGILAKVDKIGGSNWEARRGLGLLF